MNQRRRPDQRSGRRERRLKRQCVGEACIIYTVGRSQIAGCHIDSDSRVGVIGSPKKFDPRHAGIFGNRIGGELEGEALIVIHNRDGRRLLIAESQAAWVAQGNAEGPIPLLVCIV